MWTPATITAELEASGFIDVRWPPAVVGAEGRAQVGEAYWRTYLAHPYHEDPDRVLDLLESPS